MQLKYVGDMPIVSKKGVGFDHTQPDKYIYLQAAAELLEALSYGVTQTTQHLHNAKDAETSSSDLLALLKKHIKNIDKTFQTHDAKANEFVDGLIKRVEENDGLSEDEKIAWLGNIKMMKDYFYQYVANKSAYEAALDALSDEIHDAKIEEISVPMFKNYGMVINDLSSVLERRKAPIDSEMQIEQVRDELIGTLKITHR
jgi:transcriptional regulator of heat shock response